MLYAPKKKDVISQTILSCSTFQSNSKKGLRDLPISIKMGLGYGLAFSITVVGIVIGFAIAQRQVQKALSIYEEAIEDIENISELKSHFIELTYHQRDLVDSLETPNRLTKGEIKAKLHHFVDDSQKFEASWQVLVTSDEFQEVVGAGISQGEIEVVEAILENFDADINEYLAQIENLRQSIDPLLLRSAQTPQLLSELRAIDQTDFILNLENFIETVNTLSQAAKEEHREGETLLLKAMSMQRAIFLFSILASSLIGLLIVYVVSRLVLSPVYEVTEIAQQSIRDTNFDLEVPVTSQDEAGILASTFNTYMSFVKKLLTESEQTNQQLQTTLKELSQAQTQMVQNEKMSSLGQLVAGIAHEINNPVNFIHGNVHHVKQYIDDILGLVKLYQECYPNPTDEIEQESEAIDIDFMVEDLPKVLDSMQVGTDRIRSIVLSLRNFSRVDESELKAVDLHEGIDSTLVILNHRLKASFSRPEIKVVKAYGELPLVECYAGPLNQVYMNIISNAVDALEEKILQLNTTELAEFAPQITITTSLVDRTWVRIAIADNGPGIPPDIQKNIFEPFFTTKAIGKGTGMGMSISHQIICEKHNGTLKCNSSLQTGTEFIIHLPQQSPVTAA